MTRPRLRPPSPALAVALLALFVALTGGAYAATKIGPGGIKKDAIHSKHIRAKAVKASDLGALATFRRGTGVQAEQTVLRLAGLELRYSCSFNGVFWSMSLSARSTAPNAYLNLGFITGGDGAGSSFYAGDTDFDPGETFDLDRGRIFGRGTLVYSRPNGVTVSVTYGFESNGAGCLANGVAIGG